MVVLLVVLIRRLHSQRRCRCIVVGDSTGSISSTCHVCLQLLGMPPQLLCSLYLLLLLLPTFPLFFCHTPLLVSLFRTLIPSCLLCPFSFLVTLWLVVTLQLVVTLHLAPLVTLYL
jgi:hypothetical protein